MEYVNAIRLGKDGYNYNVYTSRDNKRLVYKNVCHNIVRCAMREDSIEYLIKQPTNGREFAFPLTENDRQDFLKYQN